MILHCMFVDKEVNNIVEHYLCCIKVGVSGAAQAIFDKLNQFIEEHYFVLNKV